MAQMPGLKNWSEIQIRIIEIVFWSNFAIRIGNLETVAAYLVASLSKITSDRGADVRAWCS